MPTDPEKLNALAIASHALVMSVMDTLISKSILAVDDEAKSVINSAISAIDNTEGLTNSSAAISILQASLITLDK